MKSIVGGAAVTLAIIVLSGLMGGVLGCDFITIGSTYPKESIAIVVLLLACWAIAYIAGRNDQRAAMSRLRAENKRLKGDKDELDERLAELADVDKAARRLRGIEAAKHDN